MEASEHIEKFQEFFESYKEELHEIAINDLKSININFSDITKFDLELGEELLNSPEDVIRAAELAISNMELPSTNIRIRIINLPKTKNIKLRDIRSIHINKFINIEGLVRQTSDVRPQVVSAMFECPSCGTHMTMLQLDSKFKEPSRCSCGRRGKFRVLSKDLVDAQRIIVEEVPESLEGGEQPKRLAIFLKEDLVDPKMEKRSTPGSKIGVVGIIKEVVIPLSTGGQSTRYDLVMECNSITPMEETFEDIKISKKDEEDLKELAKDPMIYEKLISSIAPSIYGHELVKEAIVLQLMGGVKKIREDGTKTRGDMHVLLVGDPGCISGDSQVSLIYKGMRQIQNLGQKHMQPIKEAVVKIRKNAKDKYYDYATTFQHYPKQPVLKIVTETGKEVICTYNQPLLTKNGWERADELFIDDKIRVMPKIPSMVKKLANTEFVRVEKKSGELKEGIILPDKVTPDLASLYGYILGDGNIHPNGYRVNCYVNNEETDLIGKLSELWKGIFNVEPAILTSVNEEIKIIDDGNGLLRQFRSLQPMHILEINSRQIAFSLSFLSNKGVPQQIFGSPLNVISKFISWLFEADGCAFGNGRGRTAIQLKSKSDSLLHDVQLLLLYFGIQSRIVGDNLCIRRSYDIEMFAKYIGFNSEKKKNRLNKTLETLKDRNNIQKRKKFQRWEKISKIIPFGVRDVYDFEVPISKSFIANGIVCHNSGKSQLLQFVSKAAPKARYISGKGASAAGMTATVVKDEFLRGWALEAGALVLANKGIACLDEMDKISEEDTSSLHEAMEQQSYHPDLEIMFSDGSTKKIGDFVDSLIEKYKSRLIKGKNCEILPIKDYKVLTTDFKKTYKTKIDRVSRHKAPDYFIKVTYNNGRDIFVTPEHPLFIFSDGEMREISAEHVKINSLVPAFSRLNTASKNVKLFPEYLNSMNKPIFFPETLNERLSRFLGYVITEGHTYYNPIIRYAEIGVSNTDYKINNQIKDIFENEFKTTYNVNLIKAKNKIKATKDLTTIRCCSIPLYNYMKNNFKELTKKARDKRIPENIKVSYPNIKKQFLKAAFEGDGFVDTTHFGYSTSSLGLAKDYQDVLLHIGIYSYISKYKSNKTEYYKVNISGVESIEKFLNLISTEDKRYNRINKFLEKSKEKANFRDIIPFEHIKIVNEVLKELKISDGQLVSNINRNQNAHRKTIKNYIERINDKLGLSKEKIKSKDTKKIRKFLNIHVRLLASELNVSNSTIYNIEKRKDSPEYLKLLNLIENKSNKKIKEISEKLKSVRDFVYSDLKFLRIKNIEIIPNKDVKWVYDVTVEPNHTFISEGLILHNTVTISKANIQATLRTETTVLAAANPKFGRFDPYATIAGQIDMPPTLINRFDLIFPIRDLPNKEKDEKIASHVLEIQRDPTKLKSEIPVSMLKKYIAYVKQKTFPKLSKEAIDEIKNFYVGLRNLPVAGEDTSIKPIPISARQLEALVRLAEGSARVRLSKVVTKKDSQRAINILKYCLMQVGFDYETGQIDIDRISSGMGASERGKILAVREIINELDKKIGKEIPVEDILAAAAEKGIDEDKVNEAIEKLKRSGEVFQPKQNFISKI